MKLQKYLICFLLLNFLSGCLRFTPSRESLSDGEDSAKYAGEEAFYSFDKIQNERLNALISERKAAKASTVSASYRIGVDDVIDISVFDAPEMNRKIRVRPDGFISLPLIGNIKLQGLTEDEAQKEITKSMNKFMHNPQVQLYISEYAAHKVWVVGEIYKPGAYPLTRDNYSLIELLSEAGGRKEKSSSMIILIPESSGIKSEENNQIALNTAQEKFGIEIPYESLIGSATNSPVQVPLKAGDTIVIPEAGKVQLDGEVASPGSFELPSKMTLMGAIATAGGLNYSADIEAIEVIREVGNGQKALITVDLEKVALKGGSDITLRNGDLIRVPSDTSRFFTNQTVSIINGIVGRAVGPVTNPVR